MQPPDGHIPCALKAARADYQSPLRTLWRPTLLPYTLGPSQSDQSIPVGTHSGRSPILGGQCHLVTP
jgi:hypothetical protein